MKKIFYFAAALMCFSACTNDDDNATSGGSIGETFATGQKVTISTAMNNNGGSNLTQAIGTDNGTTIDYTWEEGDSVLVKVNSETAVFKLVSGAGTKSATFEGEMPAGGTNFTLQYPVEEPNIATQNYNNNLMPKDKLLFKATNCTLGNSAQLVAQNAIMQLDLYGTDQTIGSIVVNANSTTYTLNVGAKTIGATEGAATPFYIIVPAGAYNFSVDIYNNATTPAKICSFSTTEAKAFTAGACLGMPAKEVKAVLATKGTAKRTGNIDVEWVQLWAGGPKWATYNVGATSVTECGGYYCWGGSYENGEGKAWTDDRSTSSSSIQYGSNDTAKKLWGDNWQMPSKADFENLTSFSKIRDTWTDDYKGTGVKGMIITGIGDYAENSIFIPAGGFCYEGEIDEDFKDTGYIWGADPGKPNAARYCNFSIDRDSGTDVSGCGTRSTIGSALNVRAILHE